MSVKNLLPEAYGLQLIEHHFIKDSIIKGEGETRCLVQSADQLQASWFDVFSRLHQEKLMDLFNCTSLNKSGGFLSILKNTYMFPQKWKQSCSKKYAPLLVKLSKQILMTFIFLSFPVSKHDLWEVKVCISS